MQIGIGAAWANSRVKVNQVDGQQFDGSGLKTIATKITQALSSLLGESTGRTIFHAAATSMAVRIAGMALSYLASVLMSRLLGVAQFGQYAIALSWSLVLVLPAKAGFDTSALRYSTIYLQSDDLPALRGFLRFGSLIIVLLAVIIGSILVAIGSRLMPVSLGVRLWSALLILPLALLAFYSVVMRTAHRIVASQLYEQVVRPAFIIVAILATVLAGARLSVEAAMGLTAAGACVALLGIAVRVRATLRAMFDHKPSFDPWREWLAVSAPMLMLGVAQELLNQVDIILLGQLSTDRQAAFFAASWRIASLVPFGLVGLATMAGPLIAAAYHRRDVASLHRVAAIIARTGFAFALVLAAALFLFGKWLLGMFGPNFVAAQPVLLVLLIGGVVNAFTGVVAYLATLTGRERVAVGILAGALILSIGLNVMLIPLLGAVGAAIASSSGTTAWNLAMLVYVRRSLGIDASALALAPRAADR